MIILDGKSLSKKQMGLLQTQVQDFVSAHGMAPGLAVILVGGDPASQVYVSHKHRACQQVGMVSQVIRQPDHISQKELLSLIDRLNEDEKVHGILIQLPLPAGIDSEKVLAHVAFEKDVDGFHPYNTGRLFRDQESMVPCTPLGVMVLLKEYGIAVEGANVVVIGKSNIVGKPMAALMMNAGATVSVCHSKTKDLTSFCQQADIIVSAAGRPDLIRANMIRPDAVVIDVGINRRPDGKLVGDVAFDEVSQKARAITPVPGGVGPMTIAMLLTSTLRAAQLQIQGKIS
ncbi:MAG: bifunctional methylenetetrahydrofolate dehydrogenase/methenyltetrahydrofolate cyclohydrolase FolD [Bdellovibrionota bacterium]